MLPASRNEFRLMNDQHLRRSRAHARPRRGQRLAARAEVNVAGQITIEVIAREGAILTLAAQRQGHPAQRNLPQDR